MSAGLEMMATADAGRSYLDRHETSDVGVANRAIQEKGAADKLSRVLTDANENSDKQEPRGEDEKSDQVATVDADKSCSPLPSPLVQCKQASASIAKVDAVVEQVAVAVAAQTLAVTTKEFVSLLVLGENSSGQENEPSRAQSTDRQWQQQQQRQKEEQILSDGPRSAASDELISADADAAARPPTSGTGEDEQVAPAAPRLETHATSAAAPYDQQTGDFPPQQQQVGVIVTGADGREQRNDYEPHSQYYTQPTLFYIGDERAASPRSSVLYAPQDAADVSGHCQGACCRPMSRNSANCTATGYFNQDHLSLPLSSSPSVAYRSDGCSSSASNNSSNLSSQPALVIDTDTASSCTGGQQTTGGVDEFVPCSPEGYLLLGGSGDYGGCHPSGQQLRARRESSLMCEAFEQSVLASGPNDDSSSSPRCRSSSSLGGVDGAPSSGGGRNSRQDTESLTTPPPSSLMLLTNAAGDTNDKQHYYETSPTYEIVPYIGGGGGSLSDGASPATCCSSEPARLDDHQYCTTTSVPYASWTTSAEAPQTYHYHPSHSHPDQHNQYLPSPHQQVAAPLQYQPRPSYDCQMRSNEDYRNQTSSTCCTDGQYKSQCASADAVVCHERGQQLIEWKPAEQQQPQGYTGHHQSYAPLEHHQYATTSGSDGYVSEGCQQDHYQYAAASGQYEPEKPTHHLLESHQSTTSATYDAADQTYHETYADASNASGYYSSYTEDQHYQQQGYSSYNGTTIGHESYANYSMPIVSDHYDPSVELGSCLRQFELAAADQDDEGETSRSSRPASRAELLMTRAADQQEQSAETTASESARKLNQARAAAGGTARAAASTAAAGGGGARQELKKVGCSAETIAILKSFLERRMKLKEKGVAGQQQSGRPVQNMPAGGGGGGSQRAGQHDATSFSSYNSVQQTSAPFTNRTLTSFASQPSTSGGQLSNTRLTQPLTSASVAPTCHVPQTTTTNGSKKANSLCSESCVSTPASSCESNEGGEEDVEDRLGAARRAASVGAPDHQPDTEQDDSSPKSLPVIVFQQQEQRRQRRPSLIVNNSQSRRRTRSGSGSGSSEEDGRRHSSDFSGASPSSGGSEGEHDVGVQTRASKRRRLQQQQQQQQGNGTKQSQATCSQSSSGASSPRVSPQVVNGADDAHSPIHAMDTQLY